MIQDYGAHPPQSRLLLCLQFLAFAATLLGLKLWLIHSYGNEVPFWDQWDAEAAFLYQPFLRGDLSFFDLFAPHNEHRIFTTRVLGLLLLQINGLWSPMLQMVVNAVLHVLALGTAVWLMSKAINNTWALAALLFFTALLFGAPFGLENTLAGFQAQFYFVLLFSVMAIWWLVTAQALSRWWWLGVVSAIAAFFSLASGVFAFAAASVIMLVRFILVSRDKRELAGAALLMALFAVGVFATPVLPGHAHLKAVGIPHFLEALNAVFSWPLPKNWLFSTIRNLPAAVLVGWALWTRPSRSNPVWFLVALTVWFGGQAAAVAYGRANDALASRYLDLHAMGVLVNFASLIAIYTLSQRRRRDAVVIFACVWSWAMVIALFESAYVTLPGSLAGKRDATSMQETSVKRYLADRDVVKLRALPYFSIPYPDADRLAGLLDALDIRAILPTSLQRPLQPAAVTPVDGSVFVHGGAHPNVPPCDCEFLGSYGSKGDAAIGAASIRYDPGAAPVRGDRVFMMKIAGYPSAAGNIDVIQGDRVQRMRFAKDPGETWVKRYISVHPNEPFVIRLADDSDKGWLAVSEPIPVGRLAPFLSMLLSSYGVFLAIGAAILGCLFLGWLRRKPVSYSSKELTV